ncbi:hypothetical protein K503DRAFT_163835 [Rhizopogon vinicolor AM-OR11-026]|uniref:Uncharacterized protein n=1 Tax=Rhizopogon vinicolor AM-OR11-026 TaxID=1314800 RepID=A0A1B7N0H7_9AGAM|nr:hypothetical protein K503DRAFT_163835 [Rhizopogon vinicolor AM-OR11-026]
MRTFCGKRSWRVHGCLSKIRTYCTWALLSSFVLSNFSVCQTRLSSCFYGSMDESTIGCSPVIRPPTSTTELGTREASRCAISQADLPLPIELPNSKFQVITRYILYIPKIARSATCEEPE